MLSKHSLAIIVSITALFTFYISGWNPFKKSPASSFVLEYKEHSRKTITVTLDPLDQIEQEHLLIDGVQASSLTYQLALSIKAKVESELPSVRIILLREALKDQYERISWLNQNPSHLYINLQAYQTDQQSIGLYYMLYRQTDIWSELEHDMVFLPLHLSHKPVIAKTLAYRKAMLDVFAESKVDYISKGLPLKALIGLIGPSFVCQLGLTNKNDYTALVYD